MALPGLVGGKVSMWDGLGGKRWFLALVWGHLGNRDASGWVIVEIDGYGWKTGPHPCSTEPGHGEMSPHREGGFPNPSALAGRDGR